jgi:hypothetical protein
MQLEGFAPEKTEIEIHRQGTQLGREHDESKISIASKHMHEQSTSQV